MSSPYRILFTGSRSWSDRDSVLQAFRLELLAEGFLPKTPWSDYGFVAVHGGCPTGVDAIVHGHCVVEGWPVERYRARDFPSFKARNQYMVDLGADVCLAFATRWGSGTGQTARMARRAGILTIDYGVSTE